MLELFFYPQIFTCHRHPSLSPRGGTQGPRYVTDGNRGLLRERKSLSPVTQALLSCSLPKGTLTPMPMKIQWVTQQKQSEQCNSGVGSCWDVGEFLGMGKVEEM